MPTPNSEINTDVKFSVAPLNVDSNSDDLTDIILLSSEDANMDTFSEIPLEFDSSNSSVGTLTLDSAEDSTQIDVALPMLTDIAEETIYETEFFEDSILKENKNVIVQESNDISNILMETITAESNENSVDDIFAQSTDIESVQKEQGDEDDEFLSPEILMSVNEFDMNVKDEINLNLENCSNGIVIATPVSESKSPANEVSNLITVSNNTNLVSSILENTTMASTQKTNNISLEFVANPKNSVYTNLSNVIQINTVNSNNISTLQPIAVQSGPKFVPISIAPSSATALKRPATISVGTASSNVLTKVIVSQGKTGQPIRILPNTVATSSPVKTITAAQAKQMGIPIKLKPIMPSTTKPLKQKLILSNIPPGAQVLRKIQPLSKPSTPTKILPAPLVSKSVTGGQSQRIILHPDYMVKAGTSISAARQMILANLKSAPVVTTHGGSPKKQVQYIKLINNVGSTNLPTITTAKGKFTAVTQNSTITKIDKDTPIIVATSNFAPTDLNVKTTNNIQTSSSASTSGITVVPVLPSSTVKTTPGQRLILPAVTKPAEIVNQSSVVTETKQTKSSGSLMYLPDEVLKKIKSDMLSTPVKIKEESRSTSEMAKISHDSQEVTPEPRVAKSPPRYSSSSSFEATGGLKSRKPCNCTRSQCLKLYCECFANGEFCNNCNCTSCHNNISHEENRQNAIRSCLDRNPQAFRPKIGKCLVGLSDRRHTKGCHCKRSGCLKNYCECYEAQIPCSDNCKCVGCKNIDDGLFTTSCSTNNNNFDKSDQPFEFQTFSKNKLTAEINDAVGRSGPANPRHAFSFIKDQVVEATCQCLLAQAEDVKRRKIDMEDGKKYILEEFGRCLIQIIECAPDKYLPS